MRQKNGWIKVVIVILVLVLSGLLGFAALDLFNSKKNGGYQTVPMPDSTAAQEADWNQNSERPVMETGTLEEEPESAANLESSTVTLMFAGDVLLSNHVLTAYDQADGIHGVLDEGIRSQIDTADIFMVNQEFPFSDRGTAVADKQFTFRLPPLRVNLLKEMNIDIVTLANNHILDFGIDALLDSESTLNQTGIAYVGAGENLERAKQLVTMEAGDKIIGYLGASRVYMDAVWAAADSRPGVLSTYDPKQLVEEIKAARSQCDYLVVYVHWGIEKDTAPQEYQRMLGKAYIDAGADLVVGSHPHVLQGVEYYNGKPIVYSLGNFVFGSSIPRTALLKVELEDEGTNLSVIPCTSSAGFTRLVEEQDKVQEFYRYMTELSFGVTFDEDGNAVWKQ